MKTFVPGAIASAADVNNNFNELATTIAKQATVIAGDTLAGQAMPASAKPILQAGTVVVSVDPNGFGGFAWPTPFPNGLITVIWTSGDTTTHGGALADGSLMSDKWQGRFQAPGHPGGLVRANYIAIGW
ncbi:hypothetical protein FAM19031_000595 [Propionibacterium freudenreichii]|uniref:gp53-like domain-containing protein n=1 Tax=Propionibacterium freudenreichii TaxID=1744 RepID=UPI002550F179|nr:hypothetical protein [Propionibacterium freudenreichii]MDK9294557.1 hypothetical protein [Propionibacterium freudenreichii]MDK9359886.1 hypothetical protein [Propionibacterium freudenreichii]